MISLRLTRVGKKKRPLYRLIAIPKHKDPWSKCLEYLGIVDPRTKENTLNADRIKHWLSVGAQPSDTVHNLLIDEKIIDGEKANVTSITKKRRGKMEANVKIEADKKIATEEAAKAKIEKEKAEAEAAKVAQAEAEAAAKMAEAEIPTAPIEEVPTEASPAEAPVEEAKTEPTAK